MCEQQRQEKGHPRTAAHHLLQCYTLRSAGAVRAAEAREGGHQAEAGPAAGGGAQRGPHWMPDRGARPGDQDGAGGWVGPALCLPFFRFEVLRGCPRERAWAAKVAQHNLETKVGQVGDGQGALSHLQCALTCLHSQPRSVAMMLPISFPRPASFWRREPPAAGGDLPVVLFL